jgi:hypothetical protein
MKCKRRGTTLLFPIIKMMRRTSLNLDLMTQKTTLSKKPLRKSKKSTGHKRDKNAFRKSQYKSGQYKKRKSKCQ